jgi:hypothetical protein
MKKTEKIRYEIDPHNRLVFKKTGKKSEVSMFRTVLDGKFEIDKNSSIIYHVKKSQCYDVPQQLKLKGEWSLDKDHNLVLTLDKWGNQIAGNKLTIESELIDAKANMLFFAVATRDAENKTTIYVIKLGGKWQADEHNRLTFNIENETGLTHRITLQGIWEVNRQNEIIYTYEKSTHGKKEKRVKTITFNGYWNIAGKHRIIYVLNKEINSELDFKVSIGKPSGKGLQYEMGIGATSSKKIITLFGNWKVNKNLGLLFEMPYEEGNIQGVTFGGWVKFGRNNILEIRLQNKTGEDLGIDIKLSRSLIDGEGEAFIRALRSQEEVSIVAGLGFRW